MKHWIWILALLIAPTPARAAEVKRTGEILENCTIAAADPGAYVACMSYISGILDGFYRVDQSIVEESNSHEGFFGLCLPVNGVRGDVLVAWVKTHVESFPKDAGLPARTVIFGVLKEMYPCKDTPVKNAPAQPRP